MFQVGEGYLEKARRNRDTALPQPRLLHKPASALWSSDPEIGQSVPVIRNGILFVFIVCCIVLPILYCCGLCFELALLCIGSSSHSRVRSKSVSRSGEKTEPWQLAATIPAVDQWPVFIVSALPHHIGVGLVTRAIHGVGYPYDGRYGMDMKWVSGGYGYFWVKRFGEEWVTV